MKAISTSFLNVCFGTLFICSAKAEIIEDGTTNTQVISTDNGIIIENGDRKGSNLFHSFKEFSVSQENPVFFNNANDISHIFSRVTGGNISKIDGLIGANGSANLFLINPAGILFGKNAFLNIGGSFYGTTADSVIFPDNVEFAASNSVQPILTVKAPIGLRFRDNPGAITNRSVANDLGLAVRPGQSLALIGGNISLEGGKISVAQGNIELGSVADNSFVNLVEQTDSSFSLGYGEVTSFNDITLNQSASINANEVFSLNLRGDKILLTEGSQINSVVNDYPTDIEINIEARELLIDNQANISTITLGTGNRGEINLNIADSVEIVGTGSDELPNIFAFDNNNSNIQTDFTNLTGIFSITRATGAAKNINLTTSQLQLKNGGVIGSFTLGEGTSGILTINPTDSLEIINAAIINTPLLGSTGNGTKIEIDTGTLNISENGVIVTGTLGEGDGSDILIEAATEINLLQSFPNSFFTTGILSSSGSSGNGVAGDITIQTQRLNIQDGSQITSTSGLVTDQGSIAIGGSGGHITINADESLKITSNNSDNLFRASGIYIATFTDKDTGVIDITTDFLSVTHGGQINSSTLGQGKAGDIEISTNNLVINNGGTLISGTGAAGDAGTIKIEATESIDIRGVENGFIGGEIITASAIEEEVRIQESGVRREIEWGFKPQPISGNL